jgi:shikimate dehydrogenase
MTYSKISGTTKILAVIGHPVDHTGSPAMHNFMCQQRGLDYVYVAFNIDPSHLESAISGIRSLNIVGVNVTIPYKEAVIPFLDQLDPLAQKIGAVNTIVNQNGLLIGYNTDGQGFLQALMQEHHTEIKDKNIVILGAGGAAKSIAYSVSQKCPKSVTIANRTIEKATALAASCGATGIGLTEALYTPLSDADIVINTTAVGMGALKDRVPVSQFDWVNKQLICDIIYSPSETLFLKESRLRGAVTLNGKGMLAGQGQLAFELFTGVSADYALLKAQLVNHN